MKVKTGMMLNTKKLERKQYENNSKVSADARSCVLLFTSLPCLTLSVPLVSHVCSQVTFTFHNISSHMRDVHFFYKKKTFPRIADEGAPSFPHCLVTPQFLCFYIACCWPFSFLLRSRR